MRPSQQQMMLSKAMPGALMQVKAKLSPRSHAPASMPSQQRQGPWSSNTRKAIISIPTPQPARDAA